MRNLFYVFFFALFILSSAYSQKSSGLSDQELIKLYTGLRVADVSDGMDLIGLHDQGLMDPSIEALWKDIENFDHQMCGIALTVRYVPTNKKFPTDLSKEDYENSTQRTRCPDCDSCS